MASKAALHGRNIFIYSNIQTKQVVYSLTRTLNNNDALKQLPFIAKKTVPAALRKDHWTPLATVTTPSSRLGLNIFRRLREFRIMHETMDNDPKLRTMPKKDRKYALMNQRANSIADLAASIEIEVNKLKELAGKAAKVAKKEEEVVEQADANLTRQMKRKERKRGGVTLAEKAGVKEMELKEVLEGDIVVAWKDLLDAEFAQSWPARVIHRPMGELDRYSAPKPQLKVVVEKVPAEVVEMA